jgi:hypothetical protein
MQRLHAMHSPLFLSHCQDLRRATSLEKQLQKTDAHKARMVSMSMQNDEGQIEAADAQTGYTLGEMQQRINTDAAFRDAYLQNPEEYESRIVPTPAESSQETPSLTPQGEQETSTDAHQVPVSTGADEEIEITTRIPRALLGTYAVNRAPNEALLEALKGLGEKDRVIEFLKQKAPEAGDGLKRKLELFRAEQAQVRRLSIPDEIELGDDSPISLDDIPSDETLYDPENAGKLLSAMKKLAQQNQNLRDAVKKSTEGARKALVNKQEAELHKRETELVDDLRAAEVQQIAELQKIDPALSTPIPFPELDLAVDSFYKRIAVEAGVDPTSPQAISGAVSRYYGAGPEAEALRQRCSAKAVVPPEGIETHGAIMRLYSAREAHKNRVRSSLKEKFGREVKDYEIVDMVPSYGELYAREVISGGGLAALQARARAEGARQVAAAAPDPTRVAREVPPNRGTPNLTLDAVRPEDLIKLLNMPTSTYSLEQALLVKQYYDSEQVPAPESVLNRITQLRPGG